MGLSGIRLSTNSQELLQPPITIIILKTIYLSFYQTTRCANNLMISNFPNGWRDLTSSRGCSMTDVTTYSYHPVYIVNMDLTWKKEKKTWFITLTLHESHDVAKSPATRLSVQQPLQANIEELTLAPHYLSVVRGIHRWPVDSLHKVPASNASGIWSRSCDLPLLVFKIKMPSSFRISNNFYLS